MATDQKARAGAQRRMMVSDVLDRLGEQATSANHGGQWEKVAITTLLDCCGFVPPELESPEGQDDRQIRALDMLGILSGQLSPPRRSVFQRSARLYMTDSWGWNDYEARQAIKEICNLFPPGVKTVQTAFVPRLLSEVLADPSFQQRPEWLIEGYAGRAIVTLLSGHAKCGKTTFVSHAVMAVTAGNVFLGRSTIKTAVLWLNLEQTESRTAAGFCEFGVDELPIYLFTGTKYDFTDAQLAQFIKDKKIGLLVVDSLSKFWSVEDENDATQVTAELGRLLDLARKTGVAIILIHHLRKSAGIDNLDVRGSGAINAVVDISVALRKHQDGSATSRVLEAISRYDDTPDKLVVELAEGAYRRLGTVTEMARERSLAKLYEVLDEEPADSAELAKAAGVARPTVTKLLNAEYEAGRVGREGTGKKGRPFRFIRNEMLSEQTKPLGETDFRMSEEGM